MDSRTEHGQDPIVVHLWAAARAAAGVAELRLDSGPTSLAALTAELVERHGPDLAAVVSTCSVLLDGTPVSTRDPETVRVEPGAVVEYLPPFAGG